MYWRKAAEPRPLQARALASLAMQLDTMEYLGNELQVKRKRGL